ncbi:MAG: IS1595 family transposase [Elusimicrobia bacterium]|nr:IS1595 family transposase [Elusimicrobiota bacterium]MDE2313981.1 IS1595 family transposase [Elusimicrobiota bacterium]
MQRKRTSQGYPDFPRTLAEFQRRFASEQACAAYLALVRWPQGFECPRCRHQRAWRESLRTYRCRGCRKQVHLTAGTIMHRSHLPLRTWFWAAYLMSTLTPGISALQLMRQLGLGSYRTALYLCRRLRRAMVNPAREPLAGVVEADETYIGGSRVRKGVKGRRVGGKIPVAVAVENRGDHTGRIRLQVLTDVSSSSLHAFVQKNIATGSQVNTDGWKGYWGIALAGYAHYPQTQGSPERAGQILPWVHRVIGNLKTWLRGTHHGVDREHIQGYLDEFAFRYNRRRYREHAFLTLLVLALRTKQVPVSQILSGSSA